MMELGKKPKLLARLISWLCNPNKNMSNQHLENFEPEHLKQIFEIFFPHASHRISKFGIGRGRLVHYTSAASALEIMRTKEFWMREPSCMNDYAEVEHGINCIVQVYDKSETGKSFKELLKKLNPEIPSKIENHFFQSNFNPRIEHYVACLSEHHDHEDTNGRLSMWRAFGGANERVAIVLNSKPILDGPGNLKIHAAPVGYFEDKNFERELEVIVQNMSAKMSLLEQFDPKLVLLIVLNLLRITALATKHPGFTEEQEWRLIYSPILDPSPHMSREIRSIGGVVQTVCKIPLRETASGEKTGGELPGLINRIIIGPTQYPLAMRKAFVELLEIAGVPDPKSKVSISSIPIRI